ncbi:9305_t:CDS:2 [Dentiscutata heterogama]|uniref:9305_t:CDS:1 n=1 Tax=Dentiscutata heterogama TaxID=1316150 RepID=A0ACA9LFX0_9GLOM|nr:9305_t:CDS:2 [Dentiscutata heterogama]
MRLMKKENLPTEQEALQLASLQHYDVEDMDDNQDPWEIFEETVIASRQAIGYDCDENFDVYKNNNFYTSDEETIYTSTTRNKRVSVYTVNDLIQTRLNQIQKLLQLRINKCRLNKSLWILSEIQFFLYSNLPTLLKNLNKDFIKIVNTKKKSTQERLVKQILKKIERCRKLYFKRFITKHCDC